MPAIASALSQASSQIGGEVLGYAQLLSSYKQIKKDKQERDRLTPAFYKIQDEYFKNNNIAEETAGQGLTSAAKDYLTTETNRGLGTSIGAINQAGGSPNEIAKLFDSYSTGINRTAAEDAEAQLKNIQYYMNTNKDLAGQKTIQWGVNQYQPYQAKLKELTQRLSADKQNINSASGLILGSQSAQGTSLSNADLIGNLFNDNTKASPTVVDPFSSRPDINTQELASHAGSTVDDLKKPNSPNTIQLTPEIEELIDQIIQQRKR